MGYQEKQIARVENASYTDFVRLQTPASAGFFYDYNFTDAG
jgi:hypothetical protein